jgi:hypothetical protein
MTMTEGKLFVSFWHICLENLPEGSFTRRRVTADEARLSIEQARDHDTLLCLSDTDILATYHATERENHRSLCRVLTEHFAIPLSLTDFCGKGDGDDDLYCINPLSCVRIEGQDRLMIVTCLYTLKDEDPVDRLRFEIEPETVEFHVIEAAAQVRAGDRIDLSHSAR